MSFVSRAERSSVNCCVQACRVPAGAERDRGAVSLSPNELVSKFKGLADHSQTVRRTDTCSDEMKRIDAQ